MCRDLRSHGRGDSASRLAILVSGGHVTQHELFFDRRVVDGHCQWRKRALGTKSHRIYDLSLIHISEPTRPEPI
eukprot:5051620-Pyramimonas_sp.AAC.1